MACCLMAPSHYLNQFWLIISKVWWHSSKDNFTAGISAINHCNWLEKYSFKISLKSLRPQWVNYSTHCIEQCNRSSISAMHTFKNNKPNMLYKWCNIIQCCPQVSAASNIADYRHVTRWLLSQYFLKIIYNNTGDNRLLFRLLYWNHWLLKFLGTTLNITDKTKKNKEYNKWNPISSWSSAQET